MKKLVIGLLFTATGWMACSNSYDSTDQALETSEVSGLQYAISTQAVTGVACNSTRDADGDGDHDACEDGNPCTLNQCDLDIGECVYTGQNAGDTCWVTGVCAADGTCSFASCNDYNPCTEDGGGPSGCVYTPVADGTVCWTSGTCLNGTCTW